MAHPPAAVPVKGPSAKVIQLPDMTAQQFFSNHNPQ